MGRVGFPAQAGMFPYLDEGKEAGRGLPRESGDIPWNNGGNTGVFAVSPWKWGCTSSPWSELGACAFVLDVELLDEK